MSRQKRRFVFVKPPAGVAPENSFAPRQSQPPIKKTAKYSPTLQQWQSKDTVALLVAVVLWLIPFPTGHEQSVFLTRLVLIFLALLHPLYQLPWVWSDTARWSKPVRAALVWSVTASVIAFYGWGNWPPHRRQELSAKEKRSFEAPLKGSQGSTKSVVFACPEYDDKACSFAYQLIPLFLEAGWSPDGVVERGIQQKPLQGVYIVQHSDAPDPDPHNPRLGIWEHITNEELDVRQAFVNIGIEPSSASGASAAKDKLTIYIGPERPDESSPTELTKLVHQISDLKKSGKLAPTDYPMVR